MEELITLMKGDSSIRARIEGLWRDMESDPILRHSEKFYEMSREEQYVELLKRVRRYYDLYNDKYFKNFEWSYIPWYNISFQGTVSLISRTYLILLLKYPLGMTFLMFYSTLKHLGDDEAGRKMDSQNS